MGVKGIKQASKGDPDPLKSWEERGWSLSLSLEICTLFSPFILYLSFLMSCCSLLLGGTTSVPQGVITHLNCRDYRKSCPPPLEPPMDHSICCFVFTLASFIKKYSRAPSWARPSNRRLMDSLNSPKAPRAMPRTCNMALRASCTAEFPGAPQVSSAFFLLFLIIFF